MQCVLDAATPSSAALLEGFSTSKWGGKVEVQQLNVTRDEGGTFRYQAPENAVSVTCALFACDPEFNDVIANGVTRRVMLNFGRCVLRYNRAQSGTGTFDPTSDVYDTPNPVPPCFVGEQWPRYGVLSVGCWAYSNSAVIAASALLTLETEALGALAGTDAVLGCEDRPDGADCVLDAKTVALGSCVGGKCEERCIHAVDCHERHLGQEIDNGEGGAGGQDGSGRRIDVCQWSCNNVSNSALGVCEKLP